MAYNNKNRIAKSKEIARMVNEWVSNGGTIDEFYWQKIYSNPLTRMSRSAFYRTYSLSVDKSSTPKHNCEHCLFLKICKKDRKNCMLK